MVRCWKRSENRLEEEECTDGGPEASPRSHFPHKAFWVGLSASLLLVILALGLMGHFGRSQPHSQSLQTVRFTVPDQIGALINQSAVVDQQNELVTFSVTSPINRTSTVVFDIKHSLICYKPIDQESCFLRKMEESDYANVNSLLHESTPKLYPQSTAPLSQDLLVLRDFVGMPYKERGEAYRALKSLIVCLSYSTAEFLSTPDPFSPLGVPGIFLQEATAASPSPGLGTMAALCEGFSTFKSQVQLSGNETLRQTEFLGVLAASQVNVSSLEEPLQALCQDRSVHWTRRTEGPGKQRLVYFCIDICFPSNICVSVCFYYLPE